jgi:hypothetical protein
MDGVDMVGAEMVTCEFQRTDAATGVIDRCHESKRNSSILTATTTTLAGKLSGRVCLPGETAGGRTSRMRTAALSGQAGLAAEVGPGAGGLQVAAQRPGKQSKWCDAQGSGQERRLRAR